MFAAQQAEMFAAQWRRGALQRPLAAAAVGGADVQGEALLVWLQQAKDRADAAKYNHQMVGSKSVEWLLQRTDSDLDFQQFVATTVVPRLHLRMQIEYLAQILIQNPEIAQDIGQIIAERLQRSLRAGAWQPQEEHGQHLHNRLAAPGTRQPQATETAAAATEAEADAEAEAAPVAEGGEGVAAARTLPRVSLELTSMVPAVEWQKVPETRPEGRQAESLDHEQRQQDGQDDMTLSLHMATGELAAEEAEESPSSFIAPDGHVDDVANGQLLASSFAFGQSIGSSAAEANRRRSAADQVRMLEQLLAVQRCAEPGRPVASVQSIAEEAQSRSACPPAMRTPDQLLADMLHAGSGMAVESAQSTLVEVRSASHSTTQVQVLNQLLSEDAEAPSHEGRASGGTGAPAEPLDLLARLLARG
mmetsp:Transcript_131426/g.420645  ORF Transcript_131426/g.420645 Transcript_131426/m.420645 type:complete len:418 (-) Transcript_131426:81-1334(-)